MRHPSLEPLALFAARYLAGRDLLHDARALTRLGSGHLEIDLLRRSCHHQLHYIPPLNIIPMLNLRLRAALDEIPLDWGRLTQAKAAVDAKLSTFTLGDGPRGGVFWAGFGDIFVSCGLEVKLVLATDEGSWTASHKGTLEWPQDWAVRP
jgi:hypothetical protein